MNNSNTFIFSAGKALLLLLPSEVKFVKLLKQKKVELKKVQVNPKKLISITPKIRSFLSEDNGMSPPDCYMIRW